MIEIHTLGTARIDVHTELGKTRITPVAGKRFGLLLYLTAQPANRAARSALQDLLFPPTRGGRHGLRELLYQVRRCGVEMDSDAHTVEIHTDAVRRDWAEFSEATALTLAQLRVAEAGFLPGYKPSFSPAFVAWYERFSARAIADLCQSLLREVERALNSNDLAVGELAARACLALDPSNSHAAVVLAYVLARRASSGPTLAAPALPHRG